MFQLYYVETSYLLMLKIHTLTVNCISPVWSSHSVLQQHKQNYTFNIHFCIFFFQVEYDPAPIEIFFFQVEYDPASTKILFFQVEYDSASIKIFFFQVEYDPASIKTAGVISFASNYATYLINGKTVRFHSSSDLQITDITATAKSLAHQIWAKI